MKKLLLTLALGALLAPAAETMANSTYYYAKMTVDVAEESRGLGTVYLLDTVSDQPVEEAEGVGVETGGLNDGATVAFTIVNEPADGYVLANFTDRDGNVFDYERDYEGNRENYVCVYAQSTDPDAPTVFNLLAHFVPEGELPKSELVSVTVSATDRYATYFSPVDTEIPYDMTAYTVDTVSDGTVTLTPVEGTVLPAFTAAVVENIGMFSATMSSTYDPAALPGDMPSFTTGLLTGCLEDTVVPEGGYLLGRGEDGESVFARTDGYEWCDAYRCWLEPQPEAAAGLGLNVATGVARITDTLNGEPVYDANGVRRNGLEKGLNICGGLKIIVK